MSRQNSSDEVTSMDKEHVIEQQRAQSREVRCRDGRWVVTKTLGLQQHASQGHMPAYT